MFFHRPSMTSTYESAESIATPPESDLDDEQIRIMLASPLYLQESEASADRFTRLSLLQRKTQCQVHLTSRESAGKLAAMFSHQKKSSQETLSDREGISSGHQPVQWKDETFFRFSDPEEAAILVLLVLDEQGDHLLAEAKSEILKQECKVGTLNTCIREFQRQTHSNRLEMDNVNYGYEESRREQARLHEELAQREKALRDTRIRNIHEVEKLRRAQEMRIDEFSRNEFRESHATIQELTSLIQELQEIMNYMNDSRESQDIESICIGKLSHVPSQLAIVPSLCGMRDQSLRHETWYLLGTSGNVFYIPFHRKLKQLFFFSGGVNFLMQLQFLAPVELFFKQLKGYSFWPRRHQYFLFMQFFPLCEIRQKAADAPITWSWHSEATRKNNAQESVPWQTVFALHLVCGARKLCCKELQVFQTSACGEFNTLAWTHKIGHVACVVWLVFPQVVMNRDMWGHSCWIVTGWILGFVINE